MELDVGVARDAGVRGPALLVGADEVLHDPPVEELLEVEREVRQAHPVRRVAGEENRIRRAARAAALLTVVQPERHGGDVVAGLLEQQGRYRRVDATAHRGDDALAAIPRVLAPFSSISPAVRFQWSSKALCSASRTSVSACSLPAGSGPPRALFDVRLGDAGRLDEVFALDQLRQRRPGRDARRAAVDLVTNLFQEIVGDSDREACDVAAGLVAGFAAP